MYMPKKRLRPSNNIPVSGTVISPLDQSTVLDCLKSGWVSSSGEFVNTFEKNFADYLNVKFALTTSNGTSALHLALASLEIERGMKS